MLHFTLLQVDVTTIHNHSSSLYADVFVDLLDMLDIASDDKDDREERTLHCTLGMLTCNS